MVMMVTVTMMMSVALLIIATSVGGLASTEEGGDLMMDMVNFDVTFDS